MKTFQRRLEELEALERAQSGADRPYVVLPHEDAPLPGDLPLGWRGKAYIGISPDDWDEGVNHATPYTR